MTVREEYKEEATKLISHTSTLTCVEDAEFTIYLREFFLTLTGKLNSGIKTKGGFYEKLKEIEEGIKEAWKDGRGD